MYEYYSELENPEEFKVYLSSCGFKKDFVSVEIDDLDIEFYSKYSDLFAGIKLIESLIIPDISLEESNRFLMEKGNFLIRPDEDEKYGFIKELSKKIKLSIYDMYDYFNFYLQYLDFYAFVFPDMKALIYGLGDKIISAIRYINSKRKIVLPSEDSVVITYPNAWFITPDGYLYNTGGDDGHKEGKLVYAYNSICENISGSGLTNFRRLVRVDGKDDDTVQKKDIVPREKIRKILDNGCVDYFEFQNYSNFPYRLEKIIAPGGLGSVSYQKNIITLVVGYLAAKEALNKAYRRLDSSSKKRELAYKIGELCNGELADILVRFAGFNKVESQRDKTICTSSLYGIKLFKEYLDRGWDLDILPGIVYDSYIDKVSEMDYDSAFIKRHLEKELSDYQGKGKVLINHKSYN